MDAPCDGGADARLETVQWLLSYFQLTRMNHPSVIGLGMLRYACTNPSLSVAVWVATSIYAPAASQVCEYGNYILEPAMQNENAIGIFWLQSKYGLTYHNSTTEPDWTKTPNTLFGCDDLGVRYNLFRAACETGPPLEAMGLMNQLSSPEDAGKNSFEVITSAKLVDHSFLARVLATTIPGYSTRTQLRYDVFRLMRHYCTGGLLDEARQFTASRKISRELVRSHESSILRLTIIAGHLEVAEWLMEEFKLTVDDVRASHSHILHNIKSRVVDGKIAGVLPILTWLVVRFDEDFFSFMRAMCEPP